MSYFFIELNLCRMTVTTARTSTTSLARLNAQCLNRATTSHNNKPNPYDIGANFSAKTLSGQILKPNQLKLI